MRYTTPIGSRLEISLDAEVRRMRNDWFFRWHHIGREEPIEIDSFDGAPMRMGGIEFFGTPCHLYWDVIQRYLRAKVCSIFDDLESELSRYPIPVRDKAIDESIVIVNNFCGKIRRVTIEKYRILRGDGINFPPLCDKGDWIGSNVNDVINRANALRLIWCGGELLRGAGVMPFSGLNNSVVTLAKASGHNYREGIPATVSQNRITIFDETLPIEVNDRFFRTLPSGVVEEFTVVDPGFHDAFAGIPAHYQVTVQRSDRPNVPPQSVVNNITNNVSGQNSRVNIASIDFSNNSNVISVESVSTIVEQVKSLIGSLPEGVRVEISKSIDEIEVECRNAKPNHDIIRGALISMRTVAEGVAGNLVASGIVGLLSNIV